MPDSISFPLAVLFIILGINLGVLVTLAVTDPRSF